MFRLTAPAAACYNLPQRSEHKGETDDESDEIIPIHSRLNKEADDSDLEDKYSKYDFDDDEDEFDSFDEISEDGPEDIHDNSDLVEEDGLGIDEDIEDPVYEPIEEAIEEDFVEEEFIEEDTDSNLEAEEMNGLEEKYSKYDFEDDSDDIFEESENSKPQFKKSVDLSKFDGDSLSDEELAEKERKAQELEEKKRRIIEGTNFDNSLRKH